jgi:uncharacterized membrane protein YgdD (TMEM256/DUF423 family)
VRTAVLAGALHAALAVALGAFAAHGLEGRIPAERLAWIETGARYQLVHGTGLLAVAALWALGLLGRGAGLAAALIGAGPLLFAGGLYLAALAGWTWLIPVVPVGGAAMIAGWLVLAVAAWDSRRA